MPLPANQHWEATIEVKHEEDTASGKNLARLVNERIAAHDQSLNALASSIFVSQNEANVPPAMSPFTQHTALSIQRIVVKHVNGRVLTIGIVQLMQGRDGQVAEIIGKTTRAAGHKQAQPGRMATLPQWWPRANKKCSSAPHPASASRSERCRRRRRKVRPPWRRPSTFACATIWQK